MLLLYELVVYISVCLLAVTGGGRAAPAIAEVRLTFTPGPCSNDTLRWNRKTRMLEVRKILAVYWHDCFHHHGVV